MVDRLHRHTLEPQIEDAYRASGNDLGWRFLYSPEEVLDGAEVAFIGLNPGGTTRPAAHAEFCMAEGSACQRESWAGFPPGRSPLQRQVLLLFERLRVRPERVLAGNLVPFRSPSWDRLVGRAQALRFGRSIWAGVLEQAGPSLVVSMGRTANEAVAAMLGIKRLDATPLRWGAIVAQSGDFETGRFVGLPHLSRFGVITRERSEAPLQHVFGRYWTR